MTAFNPSNPLNITLWKKTRLQSPGLFVKHGTVVKYRPNLTRQNAQHTGTPYLGCVRWIVSVGQAQYVVIHKMHEVVYPHGPKRSESLLDRLRRVVMIPPTSNVDLMRSVFKVYKLAEGEQAFEVIWLGGPDSSSLDQSEGDVDYPIACSTCIQPDLRSYTTGAGYPSSPLDFKEARFFASEFTII